MEVMKTFKDKLLCNTKGTEYESNSQLNKIVTKCNAGCCVIPKVLNMKAIHNLFADKGVVKQVVV